MLNVRLTPETLVYLNLRLLSVAGMLTCFAGVAAAAPAERTSAASAEVNDGEHVRLSSEIKQLSTRQAWPGVEKKFEELDKLGVELTFDDLLHGAYAARALGNAQSAYDRLKVAARLKGTKEVVDWLYTIDTVYGRVELIATPPRGIVLEPELMPFDPDQRTAVAAAMQTVAHDGQFLGLLPKGKYVFAGTSFEVQPGVAVRIEVAPRMKKTNGEIINMSTSPVGGEETRGDQ